MQNLGGKQSVLWAIGKQSIREKQDNFHTSYNCCRLAKQDNVVQGSQSKLGLPVINKTANIKGSTDGQTWRRMKRIQVWCMNTRRPKRSSKLIFVV